MTATKPTTKVMTPKFRVSFPDVFVARAMEQGQEPKFAITMLFAKDADLSALKAAAQQAVIDKWGADPKKWPANLKSPFRDQGDMEYEGYEKGCIFVRATSKQKPGVVGLDAKTPLEPADFYPGCYARATVNAFAYEAKGNKGVSFGLQNVQKLEDGDPLGGRSRPDQDFEPVAAPLGGTPGPATSADALFG